MPGSTTAAAILNDRKRIARATSMAYGWAPMALEPARTVADLRALRALTGDDDGAQRVCWTETWSRARDWYRERLAELPVAVESDEAGNLWATLEGASERAVLIGGHLDSVSNGGWLDGCLNVLGGLEVLRRLAAEGRPAATVRLVDWADEEGFRFGRSLFGSSAVSQNLDPGLFRGLHDASGAALPAVLAEHGVALERARDAGRQLEHAAAYLELHIEQGPVLERLGLPLAAVLGTYGVERHVVRFTGQRAHVGATPMDMRLDPVAAAARFVLEGRRIALEAGSVTTVGTVETPGGIVTAVAPVCEVVIDQRHLDAGTLAAMLAEAVALSKHIAQEEGCEVGWERQWQIPPRPFHPQLIEFADEAVRETAGSSHRMPSGALHDAAEMASAGVPTVMLFVQSLRGLSHNSEEDTLQEHIEASVEALDRLTSKTIAWVSSS
jgi:hydantoinase/carbamoylase family amidase